MKNVFRSIAVATISAALFRDGIAAQEWPQWRGPNRDGTASSSFARVLWPERLTLDWRVEVGSGHASPVVSHGLVYVHARENDQEVVRAIELASGREMWRDEYPAAYTMHPAATALGKGPRATPAVSNGKLVTYGINGVLSCYDARNGRLQWRIDTAREFNGVPPDFGVASSPIFAGQLVITHTGNKQSGAVVALEIETGKERWRWPGDAPSYASPVLAEPSGHRQLVVLSYRSLNGLSIDSGTLLWQVPFEPGKYPHAMTPAVHGEMIIVSGAQLGTTAFRVRRDGTRWSAERSWHASETSMTMASPVVNDRFFCGLSDRNSGQFFCAETQSGAVVWTSERRAGTTGAISKAGANLLLFSYDGSLKVMKPAERGYEMVGTYQLTDGSIWSIPAIVERRLLVKDDEHLSAWRVPD